EPTPACRTAARNPVAVAAPGRGDSSKSRRNLAFVVQDRGDDPPNTLLRCTEVGTAFAANLDRPGRLLSIRDARACTPAGRSTPETVSEISEFSSALSQNTPPPSSLLRRGEIASGPSEERSCDAHCWRWPSALSRSAG